MAIIHKNLVEAVIRVVENSVTGNYYAHSAINYILRSNPKWGSRDRKFIAEGAYEIIRNLRLLAFSAGVGTETREDVVKIVFTHLYLSGLIDEKTLNENGLTKKEVAVRFEEGKKDRRIRESVPDWLDELGVKELGAQWEHELAALNSMAKVVLRVNTLKTGKKRLSSELAGKGVETFEIEGYPDALVLGQRQNVFTFEEFKKGYFEVQDASSQKIAYFSRVKPGMRVIDACSGAGGKSLHMASLMQNKGKIIALDVEKDKLEELKRRARRNGVSIIEPRLIESKKVIKRLEASADLVLLDVPCSGLGVIRRNPDSKWKLKAERIEELIAIQAEILSFYSIMVKPGGTLVYATCSILPSENGGQIAKFLKAHPGFVLEEENSVSPARSGFDGFYMARLSRMD